IVPELEGESSQRFNFIMTPSREAATQNYPIEITVTYQDEEVVDGKRETHTVNQYVGVYVVNPKKDAEEEETSKTVPKIIIDEYTLEPGIVKAGENFKLTTTFLNTSSQKSVQNVKISLVVVETSEKTGTVFTPVQSSNTFYIDHIAPKQKATKEIMLYTIPDAQAKTYTITVKFNYEDEKGEVFSEEDLIGIPVVQPSRIELGQIQFQGEAMEGQPLGVYVELYNTGKVMLNNLMIRMESEDFDITDSNLFVGNFQQGATEYYDRAMIIPRQPGKATGKLILTYEDPTGEELIKEEEFSIEVMEMFIPPMDEEWDMPMEEPKASLVKRIFTNKYLWMGLILAGFITAGLIVRKRRKVQEGLDLDE
ncbi:MAG: S-layer protein, partial [Epulopiscium sp.]|nr:S-layer protein [Candidatus Epulonipiscium sp.]